MVAIGISDKPRGDPNGEKANLVSTEANLPIRLVSALFSPLYAAKFILLTCFAQFFFLLVCALREDTYFQFIECMGCVVRDPAMPGMVKHGSLVFAPMLKHEIWRFWTYHLVMNDSFDLTILLASQVFFGIQLEVELSTLKVALIHTTAVIATPMWDYWQIPSLTLLGSSAAAYALPAAYLVHVFLNRDDMRRLPRWRNGLRILTASIAAGVFAYFSQENTIAYYPGLLTGVCLGIILIRRELESSWVRRARWISIVVLVVIGAVLVINMVVTRPGCDKYSLWLVSKSLVGRLTCEV